MVFIFKGINNFMRQKIQEDTQKIYPHLKIDFRDGSLKWTAFICPLTETLKGYALLPLKIYS